MPNAAAAASTAMIATKAIRRARLPALFFFLAFGVMDRFRRGGLGAINGCGSDELGNVGAFRLKRRGVAELSGVGIGIESCKRGDFVRFFLLEGRFFGAESGEYRRFVRRCGKGNHGRLAGRCGKGNYGCLVRRAVRGVELGRVRALSFFSLVAIVFVGGFRYAACLLAGLVFR